MLMTPRQMIALGELYLNRGRAGATGRSRRLGGQSCTPRTRSRWDSDREYGYGWWIQDFDGHRACFAWGFGGQYIFVFRELDLVVAITSSTDVSDERRGYRRQLFDLLERTCCLSRRCASDRSRRLVSRSQRYVTDISPVFIHFSTPAMPDTG